MQAVRMSAVIGADHWLQVVVPDEIPVGAVEVIVLARQPSEGESRQTLGELFGDLDRMSHKPVTAEEVDRYLAEERASWD